MSIKERLKQSDSKLADKRKEYESMQASIELLRVSLQQKEKQCAELKTQLDTAKDPQVALTEELIDASRQLAEREELYRKAIGSKAIAEGEAQKDHRLMQVYREQPELQPSLESSYQKAQAREAQRKQLKERLPLEVLIAREKVGEQVNTAVIAPVEMEEYQTYVRSENPGAPGEFAELLMEWLGVNFVKAKVPPKSSEYWGFFKAIIPGTPELKFDSELPDEFKEANINVEAVVLNETELLLGGEQAVGKADIPKEDRAYLSTSEAARVVGVGRNMILVYIAQGKLPAKKKNPLSSRSVWLIEGADLEAFLVQSGKRPVKSIPEVVAESKKVMVAVGETGEYTLSTGKKVDSTKYYDTGQTAELLGYKESGSVLAILKRDAGRREKGISPWLPAEKCSSYRGGGRVPWRVLGQSIIDFDKIRGGKGKAEITVSPAPQSVDEVVLPETPPVEQRAITVPEQETFTLPEIAEVLGVSYARVGNLIKNDPRSEQWRVKGHSRTGYVYKDIPRVIVMELAEKYAQRAPRKVVQASVDPNLIGVVEASGYLASRLRECGVEYSASTIGTGLIARKYAKNYLEHQPGLKLPAERGEKNRILVRRDGLEDCIDEYVKEEVIKPKVKAGESYEEITAGLPEKYYDSVKAFLARRSHGDYKRSRRKARAPVTPVAPLEEVVKEGVSAGAKAVGEVAEERDYYTTSEAAELIGVTSRAVQMYIARGKIAAERKDPLNPSSAWQIDNASLDEYLVKIGKKVAPAEPVTPAAPILPQPVSPVPPAEAQPPTPAPPKPSLPAGELERRYQAITSTLGENYASKIRATTNGNIGDIEQNAFDETYLPLLDCVWLKIREMHPQEIPEELSPICRPATFSDPERLARLEAKVNLQYTQFIEKNAEKRKLENETGEKIALLGMYAGLDEEKAKALIPNLEEDGGIERIDALEKVLIGVAKSKATNAATKILSIKPEILTTQFDFTAYQAKLTSTLEEISKEHPENVPDFYNPLQSPQNFTSVEALENVARVLKKAVLKKNRAANGVAAAPDRLYYTAYTSETAKAVEDDGFDLGMVCAIVDRGLNVGGRRRFGNKGIPGDVLKKTMSRFYSGKFDGRVYETNLRKMITCGAILEQDRSGKQTYSLTTKLSDSVPAHLRDVLQPFYNSVGNGTSG